MRSSARSTRPTSARWKRTCIDLGILGLQEARDAAVKNKARFDYDRPIRGLRALDSHTLQITVDKPRPRLLYALADASVLGATAREVVEHYGDTIGEHPVGTGPFRLKSWRRTSRIVLERKPQLSRGAVQRRTGGR